MSADLYVLYRQTDAGVQLSLGANSNRPGIARTFVRRAAALNYARKHGAKVARLCIPDVGAPVIGEVIEP